MLPVMYKFTVFVNFFILSSLALSNNSFNSTKENNETSTTNQTFIYVNISDLEENIFTNASVSENATNDWETTTQLPETTESPTTPPSDKTIVESRINERNLELQDFCTCDLKASSCDINCCCDPDCSAENIMAFAYCKPGKKYIDKLYCIGEHLLFANNTPYRAQIFANDLLCIVTDNLRDRHYYPNIKGINSVEAAENMLKGRKFYKWNKLHQTPETKPGKNTFGQVLMVSTETGEQHQFRSFELPTSFPSSECQVTESVLYLEDFQSSCNVQLRNLRKECESEVLFSANRFRNLNFVTWVESQREMDTNEDFISTTTSQDDITSPSPNTLVKDTTETYKESSEELPIGNNSTDYEEHFQEYELVPVTILICSDVTHEESCVDSKIILNTTYHRDECQNVLKSIHFSIIHNGTYGIQEVVVKIQLINVTYDTKFINQVYKVSFQWMDFNETNVYDKSGSPGYIFGMPVLMGSLQMVDNVTEDTKFKEKINLDKNMSNWMTVAGSKGGSDCSQRVPITFGINVYSECEINIKLEQNEHLCPQLRSRSVQEILGFEYDVENPIRVGMYGDSNILLPVEWVPAIISDDLEQEINAIDYEEKEEYLCTNIVTSIKIEIIYALQGPFQNPQAKIIGTLYKLGKSSTLDLNQYQNSAVNSFRNLSITIELLTEVNFVDLTENSKREYPEPPKFDIKLPYDFFYPFLPSCTNVCSCEKLALVISLFSIFVREFI